jgi:hypothetical protein
VGVLELMFPQRGGRLWPPRAFPERQMNGRVPLAFHRPRIVADAKWKLVDKFAQMVNDKSESHDGGSSCEDT